SVVRTGTKPPALPVPPCTMVVPPPRAISLSSDLAETNRAGKPKTRIHAAVKTSAPATPRLAYLEPLNIFFLPFCAHLRFAQTAEFSGLARRTPNPLKDFAPTALRIGTARPLNE